MGIQQRINMQYWSTCSLYIEEQFPGVKNVNSFISGTESEYIASDHVAKEALWLHSLIQQLFKIMLTPTTMFSDNQSTIALAKDHQYHVRTKHIDIHFHFI